MKNYFLKMTEGNKEGVPSSRRFVFVLTAITLCASVLFGLFLLFKGIGDVSLVLGLAGILAGLSGSTYTFTKNAEIKNHTGKGYEDTGNARIKDDDL